MKKMKALGDYSRSIPLLREAGTTLRQQLAADPKGAFVAMIVESIQNSSINVDAQKSTKRS
jgi:hypothetical protein